jgi:hypothetical protein
MIDAMMIYIFIGVTFSGRRKSRCGDGTTNSKLVDYRAQRWEGFA